MENLQHSIYDIILRGMKMHHNFRTNFFFFLLGRVQLSFYGHDFRASEKITNKNLTSIFKHHYKSYVIALFIFYKNYVGINLQHKNPAKIT